jgi:hypothetical protein
MSFKVTEQAGKICEPYTRRPANDPLTLVKRNEQATRRK